MSLVSLKNLEVECQHQVRELYRKEGIFWMHTDMGRRLVNKLNEIQALKAQKAA